MKTDETKIEEIRMHLMEATKLLGELNEDVNTASEHVEDWMKDRIELWCRIYKEGGAVTQDKLYELWHDKMKKDNRGIGGFFNGKGASLVWTPDQKAALTKNASDSIKAWTGKTIAEYSERYKR